MKKLLIFGLVIGGWIHGQDSLKIELDVVEKGFYTVFMDSIAISNHTKPMKASAKAMTLKILNPDRDIWVQQPRLEPVTSLDVPSSVDSRIAVIRFESTKRMILNQPWNGYEFGNKCDSLTKPLLMVSTADFEFNNEPVVLRNVDWKIKNKLLNEGRQITLMDAIVDSLIVMNCVESVVSYEGPEVDVLGEYRSDSGSWELIGDEWFFSGAGNHKYLVFDMNEVEVGETYEITMDVFTEGEARFDLWMYAPEGTEFPPEYQDPRISAYAIPANAGPFSFKYTIEHVNRNRFAIRTQNWGSNWSFKNLKILKK
jgi:hypothetical protein